MFREGHHTPTAMISYSYTGEDVAATEFGLVTDARGSVRLVVRLDDGAVVQRLDYGPFGEVILDSNPGFQPFGYAGGIYDADTGLVRFGARDYDAETGRWLTRDPIGFAGGDTNLFAYVGGDPVNSVDPTGLQGCAGGGTDLPGEPPDSITPLDVICTIVSQTGAAGEGVCAVAQLPGSLVDFRQMSWNLVRLQGDQLLDGLEDAGLDSDWLRSDLEQRDADCRENNNGSDRYGVSCGHVRDLLEAMFRSQD